MTFPLDLNELSGWFQSEIPGRPGPFERWRMHTYLNDVSSGTFKQEVDQASSHRKLTIPRFRSPLALGLPL